MILSLLLVILALLFYFARWHHAANGKCRRLPPGPTPLPLIGNIHQMDARIDKTINEWGRAYGGIVTIDIGRKVVVITDHQLNREALIEKGDCFLNRPSDFCTLLLAGMANNGIIGSSGDIWKSNRRLSLHILKSLGFGRNLMEAKINRQVDWLVEQFRATNGNIYNPARAIERTFASIITDIIMSVDFQHDTVIFDRLNSHLNEIMRLYRTIPTFLLNAVPVLKYVPLFKNFNYTPLTTNMNALLDYYKSIIDEHKQRIDYCDQTPKDYIDAFLIQRQALKRYDAEYSDRQLQIVLSDLFLAGTETTTTLMKWVLLYMIKYPEVQRRCRAEIFDVLGKRRATMAERHKLPYVQATLAEVQRLANVLPLNAFHETSKDVTLANYYIPKGTTVLPQVGAVHHDDRYFPQPHKFNPARFLSHDELLDTSMLQLICPFGLGKRSCMGSQLAKMELFLAFVTLTQTFKFELAPNTNVSMEPIFASTLMPQSYQVIATEQSSIFA